MRRTPRNSFIYFFLVSTVCHFSSYASFLPLHPPLSILRCRPNKLPLAYGTPASRSQRPSVAAALFPPANDTGCLLTRHRAQVIAHFLSLSLPFSLCLLAFLLLRTSCGVPKPMTWAFAMQSSFAYAGGKFRNECKVNESWCQFFFFRLFLWYAFWYFSFVFFFFFFFRGEKWAEVSRTDADTDRCASVCPLCRILECGVPSSLWFVFVHCYLSPGITRLIAVSVIRGDLPRAWSNVRSFDLRVKYMSMV